MCHSSSLITSGSLALATGRWSCTIGKTLTRISKRSSMRITRPSSTTWTPSTFWTTLTTNSPNRNERTPWITTTRPQSVPRWPTWWMPRTTASPSSLTPTWPCTSLTSRRRRISSSETSSCTNVSNVSNSLLSPSKSGCCPIMQETHAGWWFYRRITWWRWLTWWTLRIRVRCWQRMRKSKSWRYATMESTYWLVGPAGTYACGTSRKERCHLRRSRRLLKECIELYISKF